MGSLNDRTWRTMELKRITDCCGELKINEKRCLTDEFVELVFQNDEIDEWFRIVSAFLGTPTNPKGQEPPQKDLDRTATTGGIRLEQTLFEKDFENGTIIAKFWPWKDKIHTTLRMAMLNK